MNKKMFQKYNGLNWDGAYLDKNLENLILDGFINLDDCFFLESLYALQTNATKVNFVDSTGYECFINSIHIDDYIDYDCLTQASLFLKAVFVQWRKLRKELTMKGIIIETEFGANVKFHLDRTNQKWINEDKINDYEEAILIFTSEDRLGIGSFVDIEQTS